MISNDPRTQEILKKTINFLKEIESQDKTKKEKVENTFHTRFAFLPTRLSCGKMVFLRFYNARYKAKHVNYIKIVHNAIIVTDTYKHYIDKDFEPNFREPIEKVASSYYHK